MLNDIHSILGYLIAKYYFEKHFPSASSGLFGKLSKRSNPVLIGKNPALFTSASISSSISSPSHIVKNILDFLKNLNFENKYILSGILLGNLPDLDVFFGKFFGGHHAFHRTFTHSFAGNAVIIPTVSYFLMRILKLDKNLSNYFKCFELAFACIFSHVVSDYITNYGTAIFYPFDKKLYSYGLITVFDFSTIAISYLLFSISQTNYFKHRTVFFVGLLVYICLFIWKRAMNCKLYSRYFHTYLMGSNASSGSTSNLTSALSTSNTFATPNIASPIKESGAPLNSNYIWLHPHNYKNGEYLILSYDPKTEITREIKTVQVESKFMSLVEFITKDLLRLSKEDVRKVQMSDSLGRFMGQCVPRNYFSYKLYKENSPLFLKLVKQSLPSIGLIGIFWLIQIVLKLWKPWRK